MPDEPITTPDIPPLWPIPDPPDVPTQSDTLPAGWPPYTHPLPFQSTSDQPQQ